MQVLLLKDGIFCYTVNKRDLVTSQSAQIIFEDKIGDRLIKIPILTIVTVAASDTKIQILFPPLNVATLQCRRLVHTGPV